MLPPIIRGEGRRRVGRDGRLQGWEDWDWRSRQCFCQKNLAALDEDRKQRNKIVAYRESLAMEAEDFPRCGGQSRKKIWIRSSENCERPAQYKPFGL